MSRLPSVVSQGMEVVDANAVPMGQVQDVQDNALLIRLQMEIAVPVDVIQEVCGNRIRLEVERDDWLPLLQGVEEVCPPEARGKVCCACGAMAGTDKAVSYLRKRDAWFCVDCWHALPLSEVERLVQDVSLRGVPL